MADDKDFGTFPKEESSRQTLQQELVGPTIGGPAMLSLSNGHLKRRRDSRSEEVEEQPDSCTARQTTESTDTYLVTMENSLKPFSTNSGDPVTKKSNTFKRRRVQSDGPTDAIITTIQYVDGGYIHLNPDTFTLEISNYLPGQNENDRANYLFHWEFKEPQAAQLTVQNYYVILDASTSPPRIVLKLSPNDPVDLVHRCGVNDKWMLYFQDSKECYQIIEENGVVALEKHKLQDELNRRYMFETSRES